MASSSWTHEVESSVSAPRLFKATLLDWHSLGPKIAPEIIASAAPIEGDGSVGSTRQFKFTSVMPFSHVIERLDFVDHEKFECKQTLIEGGDIGKKLETATSHFKLEQLANGGCVVKVVATYKTLPAVGVIADEEIKKAKDSITGMIKAAEGYLLANPTAYC